MEAKFSASMHEWLALANTWSGLISAVIALIVFAWPVWRWFQIRSQEAEARNFLVYHQLIREIVQPDASGATWVDRQVAAVFELRRFPAYFQVTHRVVTGLYADWTAGALAPARLRKEMQLTLNYIEKNKSRRRNLQE